MFCRAFGAPARGMRASEYILELFRLAQKLETPFDFFDVHTSPADSIAVRARLGAALFSVHA
ncbi:hypothetical protein D3C78_1921540 [compost metagenome]